ncbi:MAG: hypothetical protein GY906_23575 [bacterium]|nr:hypothetical protein [bacterium]
MEAVQNGVQNCIDQLSGTSISVNEDPNGAYRFPARTKEQLIESQQQAAETKGVDPRSQFKQLRDPASQELGAPEVDVSKHEVHSTSGLILPPGVEAPEPAPSSDGEGSSRRLDDGPMPWLL